MPGLEPWRERGDDERGETLFHASQPGETARPPADLRAAEPGREPPRLPKVGEGVSRPRRCLLGDTLLRPFLPLVGRFSAASHGSSSSLRCLIFCRGVRAASEAATATQQHEKISLSA